MINIRRQINDRKMQINDNNQPGVLYDNICLLQRAACLSNKDIPRAPLNTCGMMMMMMMRMMMIIEQESLVKMHSK